MTNVKHLIETLKNTLAMQFYILLPNLTKAELLSTFYYVMLPMVGLDNIFQLKPFIGEKIYNIYNLLSNDSLILQDVLRHYSYDRLFSHLSTYKNLSASDRSRYIPYISVDDSLTDFHYGELMDYLKKLYDPSKLCFIYSNNIVALYVTIGNQKYYLDFILWRPRGFDGYLTKPRLFLKMVNALYEEAKIKNIDLSPIIFVGDAAYTTQYVLFELYQLNLTYVGKVRGNWKVNYNGSRFLMKEIGQFDLKYKTNFRGDEDFAYITQLHNNMKVKVLVLKYRTREQKIVHIVTNKPDLLNRKQILKAFTKRWPIEPSFKDTKKRLKLSHHHFHSKKKGKVQDGHKLNNHTALRFLLYNILYSIINQKGRGGTIHKFILKIRSYKYFELEGFIQTSIALIDKLKKQNKEFVEQVPTS